MQTHQKMQSSMTVLSICMAFVLFFSSCQEETEKVSPKAEEPTDELVSFLVKSGFNEKDIELENDTYVIGGDILIDKSEVEKYVANGTALETDPSTEHYRGYYLVSSSNVSNMRFYISSSVPSSWVTAIYEAVDAWNSVNGTSLYMSITSSSSNAHTTITTGYSSQNWVARAYLPTSNGRPGYNMEINTRYNSLSSGYKKFTIVHEMGHIFGLYHTDQTQGYFINGTPSSDPNSVMNSYVLPWNGFTNGDEDAVQILYPD
ncbi:M57 family metalloprotease [Fulvivirga maritima]|uniref:M57 family metalloprotease n=1 Tax=Fulvivirga maritima TaxID=2904247 RepID=UPI001F15CFB0|nr:M57 family metalloprotease [Fulvivirga maritima]UII26414.1 M57 family metalloprotease [Fulvivirga maritima]